MQENNWWLIYGEDERIGYWPSDLLSGLKEGGELTRWGGWVSTVTDKLPIMGGGLLGNLGSQVRRCYVADSKPQYTVIQTKCYRAAQNNYKGSSYWGHSFWYGGDGGNVQDCPPHTNLLITYISIHQHYYFNLILLMPSTNVCILIFNLFFRGIKFFITSLTFYCC